MTVEKAAKAEILNEAILALVFVLMQVTRKVECTRRAIAFLRMNIERKIRSINIEPSCMKIYAPTQMARSYETEGFMFKDGDFTDEELSKYMDMDMGMGMDADLPDGIDLNDPETRSAFGLD